LESIRLKDGATDGMLSLRWIVEIGSEGWILGWEVHGLGLRSYPVPGSYISGRFLWIIFTTAGTFLLFTYFGHTRHFRSLCTHTDKVYVSVLSLRELQQRHTSGRNFLPPNEFHLNLVFGPHFKCLDKIYFGPTQYRVAAGGQYILRVTIVH
jgi:hypothetical protein